MSDQPIVPLEYDPAGVIRPGVLLAEDDLAALAPRLEAARDETLSDVELFRSGGPIPEEKKPLDSAFIDLPDRLLAEYNSDPHGGELGCIISTARRIREEVDRVVVLGIGGSYMGARALMEACCHPYHNELPRSERTGRPRLYFEGNNLDNDSLQGLLDIVGRGRPGKSLEDRWGIVVISKSGGTLETAAAFRLFLAALSKACQGNHQQIARRVVPVTGTSGKLFDLASELGCGEMFDVPDGVGGRFSIFSAVGLLPAAILGIDIVALLRGAAAMNERFRAARAADNPVLRYVAVSHLMEKNHGTSIRVLSVWSKCLEAVGLWYDQLLAESLGKKEQGATPLTTVNTRDLHSRAQQHQEGRRDKLITNLYVRHFRRDRLKVGRSEHNQDGLNAMAEKTVPELLDAARRGTDISYQLADRPTANIILGSANETSLGQFFQMMMLATVVEGRLIGVNPYGQPGVEGYKRQMGNILRGE